MADIQSLVEELKAELKADPMHTKLWEKVSIGKSSFGDMSAYSGLVGKKAGRLVRNALAKEVIDDVIAEEFLNEYIPSMLKNVYADVNSYARAVWKQFNTENKIGIDVLDALDDENRYNRLATEVKNRGFEATKNLIDKQIETVSRSVADSSIKRNIQFHNDVGIRTRVTRTYGGRGVHNGSADCEWCKSRCGVNLTLEEAYDIELFQRHEGCTCKIVATLSDGKKQDSWTKAYI